MFVKRKIGFLFLSLFLSWFMAFISTIHEALISWYAAISAIFGIVFVLSITHMFLDFITDKANDSKS